MKFRVTKKDDYYYNQIGTTINNKCNIFDYHLKFENGETRLYNNWELEEVKEVEDNMKFRVTNKNALRYNKIGIVDKNYKGKFDYCLIFDNGLHMYYDKWELEEVKEVEDNMKFRVINKDAENCGKIGIVDKFYNGNYDYALKFDDGNWNIYNKCDLEEVKYGYKIFFDESSLEEVKYNLVYVTSNPEAKGSDLYMNAMRNKPTKIKMNTDLFDSSIYFLQGVRKHLIPTIKEVISNPPTTVVGFADGTHVKSVASKGDKYDLNKGIMVCIMKHMYGLTNTQFRKMFNDIKDNKLIVHKKRVKKTVDKKVNE